MVRKKVPLRYIGEDSTRRRTYETRRNYLTKKVGELGILCNTKACVLVYDEGASEPYVYPSHAEAVEILNRYKAMPNMPQFKKTTSQEEFLTKCLAKLQHQANKLQSEREDRDIRALLHKAMLGGNLNAEEVASVGCTSGEIHQSLVERIAKTNPQLPVFQPQVPYVTGGVNMGPPSMYQASSQQQAGGQPSFFQPQAPYITGRANMGPSSMNQASPQQQACGQPPLFQPQAQYQAPPPQQAGRQLSVFQPQAPYIAGSADMGPPAMYQAPPHQQEGWKPPVFQPQAQYVTGSVDMGPPRMYQALQQQEGWRNLVRSDEDHSALVYNGNGYSTGGHDGVGTSSSASFPLDDMMSFLDDMEFELS
ncbi:hypothetical protein CFC21_021990 [Triticum aestivum]|uniref:MADS-box domain-containing protein n=2 Tax=Triticum aestivum TaxID=4565 RepID=A0A3B6C0Y1_WHEAT|nr:hypothetical protein CFC21_021990 [Triticum aestivum]